MICVVIVYGYHSNLTRIMNLIFQYIYRRSYKVIAACEMRNVKSDLLDCDDYRSLLKMYLKKVMKGVPSDRLPAEGLLSGDKNALTSCQEECIKRLGITLQIEQENYLLRHPEVTAMLEVFISKMVEGKKRKDILRQAAGYFTRSPEEIKEEINERLHLSRITKEQGSFNIPVYTDADLKDDIRKLINTNYPTKPPRYPSASTSTINTESSSFLSIRTSETTLSTPEPIPTPVQTVSETLFTLVSNTVDKAIFLRYDDRDLNYDTAYIELQKAVERAMDIPVTDVKKDIADLFKEAYELFEFKVMEKERILMEIAWEKRMRKNMKRTMRRLNNFKGYETPPTPRSEISSHASYKIPPPRPCICHPQFNYNRYPKDRFGIYLPSDKAFSTRNITVTPAISRSSEVDRDDKTPVQS